jgi:DNA polymerase-4
MGTDWLVKVKCPRPKKKKVINPQDHIEVCSGCPYVIWEKPESVAGLPIRKFFGVGKVTEEKMLNRGIKTGADLKKYKKEQLIQIFGKSGSYFYNIAHGMDERPVEPNRIRKSVGKETTFSEDIDDTDQMIEILDDIAVRLENSLIKREEKGRTITLKVKYFDFQSITRSVTIDEPVDSASVIIKHQ